MAYHGSTAQKSIRNNVIPIEDNKAKANVTTYLSCLTSFIRSFVHYDNDDDDDDDDDDHHHHHHYHHHGHENGGSDGGSDGHRCYCDVNW